MSSLTGAAPSQYEHALRELMDVLLATGALTLDPLGWRGLEAASGAGPPTEPAPVGSLYRDTEGGNLYMSRAAPEWRLRNPDLPSPSEPEGTFAVYYPGMVVKHAGGFYRAKVRTYNSQPDTHPAEWEPTADDTAWWSVGPGDPVAP